MKLGKTLSLAGRRAWRSWLAKHHAAEPEIWLVFHKKHTGKPSVPYNDAVEEALCFGWIDSTVKRINADAYAQRFSPRRPTSGLSQANKERIARLIAQRKMTRVGLKAIAHVLNPATEDAGDFVIPADILRALKADRLTWEHFQKFPASYRRIRVGWIDAARRRPAEFEKRLRYFVRMTAKNKRFGFVQ